MIGQSRGRGGPPGSAPRSPLGPGTGRGGATRAGTRSQGGAAGQGSSLRAVASAQRQSRATPPITSSSWPGRPPQQGNPPTTTSSSPLVVATPSLHSAARPLAASSRVSSTMSAPPSAGASGASGRAVASIPKPSLSVREPRGPSTVLTRLSNLHRRPCAPAVARRSSATPRLSPHASSSTGFVIARCWRKVSKAV